ncbi:type IV secretion system DNA-binding domain-containing protein [Patescibacteria group bacterium]
MRQRFLKPTKGMELGEQKDKEGTTGKPVYINSKTRSTHMHIIGASGEGKSKFMEHMIREDIINNKGLCLIDPHGHLYNDIVRWCETKGMLDRSKPKKIILFDPTEKNWTFGFNPLQKSGAELAFHVDAMVKACAKVWGGENTDQTPLLKRCLRILFHALAEKELSLLEAQLLINPTNSIVRKYLTCNIADGNIKQQWDYFNTLKPKPFYDEFGSTINRMMEFLSSPIIRNIIGQIEHTIDFRKIMDDEWILLVNLAASDRISDDNARLLGTLIVNDLFLKAKGRSKEARPFYLYIDECARYINEDIGRILDECRKFGLHLILAHQHLAQLKKAGEDIYHAIMTDAKTKVIFGGLNIDDAKILAEQVFLGELDLEEAKESLNKPVVIKYITRWFESYSKGSSHGTSYSASRGNGQGVNYSTGQAIQRSPQLFGEDQITMTTTSGYNTSSSYVESEGTIDSESESQGKIEGLEPVLEERPTQTFNLEEQIYKAMALMVNQPERHAIIKLPKKHTKFIKTPFVKEGCAREERVKKFKENCYQLTDFANPRAQIEKQLKRRQVLLERKAEEGLKPKPAKKERPEDFRN